MTNESAWFALGGVLGGVALTGLISLVNALLNHRWSEETRLQTDRQQETRAIIDRRREACHNYLVAANLFFQAADQIYLKARRGEELDSDEHVRAAITALQDAYVYVTISCGNDVRVGARTYNQSLYNLRYAAEDADEEATLRLRSESRAERENLRAAMRAELGVQD
jgi:hypothetical protein